MIENTVKPTTNTPHSEYFINVPQGRGSRLIADSYAHQHAKIVGLHTHDFSICNIVILTSKKKIVMFHVDRHSMFDFAPHLIDEINQLTNEPYGVCLISKETGLKTRAIILQQFQNCRPKVNLQLTPVADTVTGITIQFPKIGSSESLPIINTYEGSATPDNLLYHPDEEKLLSVRLIETVIGKRAVVATCSIKKCAPYVFDGLGWAAMLPHEFLIDDSHPLTKEEMSYFNLNENYFVLLESFKKLLSSVGNDLIVANNQATEESIKVTVRHLENYLNSFNAQVIFKNNMLHVLNQKHDKDLSPEELIDKNKLILALNEFENSPKLFFSAYDEFFKSSKDSLFKNYVVENYNTLHHHYLVRLFHKSHAQSAISAKERSNNLLKEGIKLSLNQKHQEAKALFTDALIEAIRGCVLSDPCLAGINLQLANSLMKINNFYGAKYHYVRALEQYERYFAKSEEIQRKIEALQKAIAVCEERIKEISKQPSLSQAISKKP